MVDHFIVMWFVSYSYTVHCRKPSPLSVLWLERYRLLYYGSNNSSIYGFLVISWRNSIKGKMRLISFSLERNNAIFAHISLTRMSDMVTEDQVGYSVLCHSLWTRHRKAPSMSIFNCECIKGKTENYISTFKAFALK